MPPSQLKRLKASLLAAGVVGPQKSKKDKKKAAQNGTTAQGRVEKHVKLQNIREEFNPFELKTTRVKHDVIGRRNVKGTQGRPGLSKQVGEDHRKATLLVEMQKRNKAGGIVDRRFGENDPSMAPEDRMLERFTREKQSRLRNGEIFNLEDDDAALTHFGQKLGGLDDFDEADLLNEDDDEGAGFMTRKRALGEDDEEKESGDDRPARKKTKAEVMKEVIAKSKQHKYERQKTKDEDDDIREELDKQMGDIWALLTGPKNPPPRPLGPSDPLPQVNAGRAALMAGEGDAQKNKQYDEAVRELTFDKRSKPADRTKTEEEKATEEAERLKKLEDNRQRRMRGEAVSDDENERKDRKSKKVVEAPVVDDDDDSEFGDAHEYNLGSGIPITDPRNQQNPDELVDGDYEVEDYGDAESVSGAEFSDDYKSDDDDDIVYARHGSDDDDFEAEFLADVLPAKNDRKILAASKTSIVLDDTPKDDKVAYTYPCPESHKDFLVILKGIPVEELPTVIQRIRILYNPKLADGNKAKLANFSAVLLDHIMHVAKTVSPIPFTALETAMRHLHALAKSHPLRISEAFRARLSDLSKKSMEDVNPGDLMMLTAITTIYPTSDMFHPVVTPAALVMARYLAQSPPDCLKNMAIGTFITTLLVQSQRLSKRILPEAINYILLSLSNLSPKPLVPLPGTFPDHNLKSDALRIKKSQATKNWTPRKPAFADITLPTQDTPLALLTALLGLLTNLSTLYSGKSAFAELFQPALDITTHLATQSSLPTATLALLNSEVTPLLASQIKHSTHIRRPLELHHHRPLPIPSNIPKFHESYSLDKRSYDPDKQRAATAKLKAEVKKERKGAMRELRKDNNFVAREKLREEKAASKEYHSKMKRLTEMIQHEEGQGKNEYERERRQRGKK